MFKLLTISLVLLTLACGHSPRGLAENEILTTATDSANNGAAEKFRVETVASNLEVPWAFAFLPDGNLLFTERPGRVRIIENGKLKDAPIFTVPDVEPSGESGLMDVSLHPDFIENRFVYLAYAYDNDDKRVKIMRYKFDGKTFNDAQTIIENLPAATNHAGTRARFGPDKKLYITVGDATDKELAQKQIRSAEKL